MSPAPRYTLCLAAAAALHACALLATQRLFRAEAVVAVIRDEPVMVELIERAKPLPVAPEPIVEPAPVEPPKPEPPPPAKVEPPLPPVIPELPPKVEPPPPSPKVPEPPPEPKPMPPPEPVVAKPEIPVIGKPAVQEFQPLETPQPVAAPVQSAAVAPPAPVAVRAVPRSGAAYRLNPTPLYPETARRSGVSGTVLLRVAVSAEGRATDVRIAESSGSSLLDRAARDAVKRWWFEPARLGDAAVADEVEVPIKFSLEQP